MSKEKRQIKQTTVYIMCCAAVGVIGCCTLIMISVWSRNTSNVTGLQDEYAVENQEEQNGAQTNGLKYTLQNPVDKIEENITSEVTEETDVQKSNRLEDIMGVLSEETSGDD